MRGLANRKVNREPVRSPSPDIANRNIITQTTAPEISQVLSKSRSKVSQTARFGLQTNIEDLQNAFNELNSKYQDLQNQLKNVSAENFILKKQISELKGGYPRNKYSVLRPFDNQSPETNLKEYQARIARFSQQIKRIHDLLLKQKQKNQHLQCENRNLRDGDSRHASRTPRSTYYQEIPASNLHFLEQTLHANFERFKAEHDLKIYPSIEKLSEKLVNVEKIQGIIQNSLNKSQYRTPRVHKQPEKYEYSTAGYHSNSKESRKIYPSENRHPEDERQLDLLRDKIRVNQLEIQMFKKQNTHLHNQLQKEKDRSFVSECHNCKIYLSKISDLQKEIQYLQLLKGQNSLYEERINHLQLEIRNLRLTKQRNEIQLRKIQELQRENEKLRQLQQQEYEKEMRRYEKQSTQNSLAPSLEGYLKRVKDVKNILSNEQFRQFLQKVSLLNNENINLQSKLDKILDEMNKNNRQTKRRQLQLKKQISQLTREKEMLKAEIQELQQSVQELKDIIDQYIYSQQNQSTLIRTSSHRTEYIKPDAQKFRNYVAEAIRHLESMQQSMAKKISQA